MFNTILRKRFEKKEDDSSNAELQECRSKLDAISRSQAVIEFNLDGTVITANDNFLATLGYELDEITGKHHKIFMPPEERDCIEYRRFWETLNDGKHHSGEFRRIGKDGNEIWIQAMYYPVVGTNGEPTKVVKFASDITNEIRMRHEAEAASLAVSNSIDQMSATISDISSHVSHTAGMAATTKDELTGTADSVGKLEESSQMIERIVDLIRSLAEQTNLLALNATIESARAGESGKGFAVVANEVKELAKQTASATNSIDASISEIRSMVLECVDSTSRTLDSIGRVNESMTSIASAVEEQSATMQDLNESAMHLRG